MELELHQLTLRYERLRKRQPAAERQLLASLAELGQQLPTVVVAETAAANRFVLIDGYKRVRAMKRLSRDTVRGTCWAMEEVEALLLERRLRGTREDAFDQAWLLAELRERFGLSLEELARRFHHSKSWVSRRLGLIETLPASIHEQVRAGVLSAYAAMKYLLPLARANTEVAVRLAAALAPLQPTSRQVAALYAGWQSGTARTRELILSSPQVYLQAQAAAQPAAEPSATQRWLNDLNALAGIARRALKPLEAGLLQELLEAERREAEHGFERMKSEVERLIGRFEFERGHAG
jgi:ParB-like chromosome segregation protein Spo0J